MGAGDIIILNEDSLLRSQWKMAKVIGIVKDRDGLVRSAKLQTGQNKSRRNTECILERPISKSSRASREQFIKNSCKIHKKYYKTH